MRHFVQILVLGQSGVLHGGVPDVPVYFLWLSGDLVCPEIYL